MDTGGWSSSFNRAISRSLLDVESITRSSPLVRAVSNWYEPGCSIAVPIDVCVNGTAIGESGLDNGAISRGRFFLWANDWLTSDVSAR